MTEAVSKIYAFNKYFRQELPVHYVDDNVVVYDDLLTPLAKKMKQNIKDHHQNTALIEGRTGSGKSTIGVKLCQLLDSRWNLSNDYIYGSSDLKRKLDYPGACPVNLLDEGSVSLNSYNSQKADDKMMTVLMDTWRSKGMTTIICMPNRNDLNKRIRNNHLDYLLKCPVESPIPGKPARGFFILYTHEFRDWGGDWWKPVGISRFSKMDKKTQQEYDQIKLEHQDRLIRKFVESDDE